MNLPELSSNVRIVINVATVAERRVMQNELERSRENGAIDENPERCLEGPRAVAYASTDVGGVAQCTNAVGKFLAAIISDVSGKQMILLQLRPYSNPARRPSFLSQFVENIKQEMQKNKEMKESLKKFREEAEKLEQSEALRTARQKFHAVESEASKSSEVIKEKLDTIKGKVCIHAMSIMR